MATARFAATFEGLTLKKDVKLTLELLDPDKDAPQLVPMRNKNVIVTIATEQQDIDDYNRSLPPQGQQMTFDQTSFQVPRYEGPDLGDGEETAEDETEELVDCPECGNLDPARQECKTCEGLGMVPSEGPSEQAETPETSKEAPALEEQAETEAATPAASEPQAEVAATSEGSGAEAPAGEPEWMPEEPYVKPEQVADKENPPAAAGER